jgi:hypothetical protein
MHPDGISIVLFVWGAGSLLAICIYRLMQIAGVVARDGDDENQDGLS